jgi:DNA-binding winged helix-turn-helix (wHTH) protein
MTNGFVQTAEPQVESQRILGDCPRGNRYIRLGQIQVDLKREHTTKDGYQIKLAHKEYRILVLLLEGAGEVVTRETICQNLWPTDANTSRNAHINTLVNRLRRALGDSRLKPCYIDTVPGKGYTLIGEPTPSDAPDPVPAMDPNQARPLARTFLTRLRQLAAKSPFHAILCMLSLFLIGMLFGAAIFAVVNFELRLGQT